MMITKEDIGKRVVVNGEVSGMVFSKEPGTLRCITTGKPACGIEFDHSISGLHNLDGECVDEYGWYVEEENIEFVDDVKSEPYSALEDVLKDAVAQCSRGKGLQRHANNNNFEDQVICVVGRLLKGHRYAAHAYQAIKKTIEAGRLYDIKGKDAAYNEILGAINYLSALAIMIKED